MEIKIKENQFFTTAIFNTDENKKVDIKVKGIIFTYKKVKVGIFNNKQENYQKMNPYISGSRYGKSFIAVLITDNNFNGYMIINDPTQKGAINKVIKCIDDKYDFIINTIKEVN